MPDANHGTARPRTPRLALTVYAEDAKAIMQAADFGIGELLFRAETMQDSGHTRQAKADRELARRAHFALARLQTLIDRNGA